MNATVSLPISELDKLRDDVTKWKTLAEDLQKTEKQVKVTIIKKDIHTSYEWYNTISHSHSPSLREYIDYKVLETKYENLDDVKKELYTQAEQKVADEISSLKADIRTIAKAKEDSEEKYRKELEEKDKEIAKLKGEEVAKAKEEEIKELKEVNKLLEEKIFTLGEKLNAAFNLYHEERTKSWWKKLLT